MAVIEFPITNLITLARIPLPILSDLVKIPYQPGLDIGRLFAAYGVMTVHLGPKEAYVDPLILALGSYRIPFFLLATSFLFSGKVYAHTTARFWKKGFLNLLVPYLVFTLIYMSFRVVKHAEDKEFISDMLGRPLEILFCGGAAIHLYYIPLLFLELIALTALGWILRKYLQSLGLLIVLFLLSTLLTSPYPYIPSVGYTYSIATTFGLFGQLQNIMTFAVNGLCLVLPCAILGLIIRHPMLEGLIIKKSWMTLIVSCVVFVISNTLYIEWDLKVPYLQNLILAGSFLLIVLQLPFPKVDGRSPRINLFLKCYYGIYLSHHLVLEGLEFIIRKFEVFDLATYDWPELLSVAFIGFLICYVFVVLVKKFFSKSVHIVGP